MKFEEVYCSFDNVQYTIDDIQVIFEKHSADFANRYKEYLLCPECKQAQLSYNNAKPPYFKAYPNAVHTLACSLQQEEMNDRQAQTFVDKKENVEKIARQLKSVLRRLLVEKTASTNSKKGHTSDNEISAKKHMLTIPAQAKRLPQKRLDRTFTEDDYNCYKIFYGDFALKWEHDKVLNIHKLLMFSDQTNKLVCKLKISDAVYKYLDIECTNLSSNLYKIVLLAKFEDEKTTIYHKTSLRFSHFLLIGK